MGESVPLASMLSSRRRRRGDDAMLKGVGFEPSIAAGFMGLKQRQNKIANIFSKKIPKVGMNNRWFNNGAMFKII
jgi:hypothetical protein